MQTRIIPSSGVALPVIGCGTWRGFDVGARPADLPVRGEVLASLFEAGGRVIDSSPMYGSAEQVVGELLGGGGLLRRRHGKRLPAWAAEIGCTCWNQLLLNFVLAQPAVTCVIPGKSSPVHMRENAAAGSGELPPPQWWQGRLASLEL